MATAAELLANGLGHDDTTLVIDNYLRTIHIPKRITNLGVEYDDDVLRLNFKMPRYLDDTDLSTFSIRINYVNANGDGDIYTVSDKVVNPDSIAFSWLVGPTATAYKGKTKFNVCMKIVDEDGNVQREYNTAIASLPVLEGLEVDEQVAAMYSDLIEQWKRELFGIGDTEEASMRAVSQEEQENIVQKGAEVLATIPEEYQNTAAAAQEGIRTKADAIVNAAEGQMITVSDSSDDHIRGLRVFGKTTQVTTTGKNLFDPSCLIEAGWSKYNETYYGDSSLLANLVPVIEFKPNVRYTISTWAHGSASGDLAIFVSVYYTDGTADTAFKTSSSRTPAYYMYTTAEGKSVDYIRFSYGYSQKTRMWDTMIEECATATEYEPYSNGLVSPAPNCPRELVNANPSGAVGVSVAGKNLAANATSRVATILNGVTFTITKDSSEFIIGGTQDGTRDASGTLVQNLVLSPGTYTISVTGLCSNDYVNVQRMQGDNGYEVTGVTEKAPKTFTIRENTMVLIQMVVLATSVYNNTPVTVQLEVGSTATEYEPHKVKQTATVTRVLSGIPVESGGNYTDPNDQQWVCDEIDFERGVYVQRVRAVEFTGSEDWMTQQIPIENGMGIYLMNVGSEGADNSWGVPFGQFDLKCSHFTIGLSGTSGKTLNTCAFNGGLNNFLINLDTSVCGTTLTAVKSWIADQYNNGTPVTVYIALANPIETPLSSTELEAFKALCSNYPNTTVYNDANAHMQLSYNVDTKTYVDNGIKKTVAEVMEAIENGSY